MGKFCVATISLCLLACQPISGQAPIIKPSAAVSPSPSASTPPIPVSTPSWPPTIPLPTPEPTPTLASRPIEIVAGTGAKGAQDGPLKNARFNEPLSCDFDVQGNLYINDSRNFRIRKIDLEKGLVSTVVGNGQAISKDGNQAEASLYYPRNMVATSTGKLYFSESNKLRMFYEGKLTTLNAHQQSLVDYETYRNGSIQTQAIFG
jgi:hypothetical protein